MSDVLDAADRQISLILKKTANFAKLVLLLNLLYLKDSDIGLLPDFESLKEEEVQQS